MIDQTLGRFRILEQIGQGGMGVVYRARDTRLNRDVALKVLPPDRIADPDRRQRFEQEARAASALQHPNIVTIYDITREGDRDVIVMELVSGDTLEHLIRGGQLSLSQTLGYAGQIADALSRAHAASLVHRDLKPSNIMVTDEGTVKILDFGLAKLFEREPVDAMAPTVTARVAPDVRTEDGKIVGTAAYMSPEQAEGRRVDSRSDVFAFGSVLYEMLTGRRAFQRDSTTRTLTAIVAEEPEPLGRLMKDLPGELERVIERCLRKDPQRRWQSMSDLRVMLQDLKEDSDSGKLRPVAAAPRRPARWGWWTAGALAGLAAALAWGLVHRPQTATGMAVTRMTFDAGMTAFPAISQDGRLFAYASDRAQPGNADIWVQQVAGGQPLRLTEHPLPDWAPSFSPDGSHIVFRSERDGGGIYLVDALGGDARRISDRGYFPQFSPDGSQICYVDIPASLDPAMTTIHLVDARGGPSRPVAPEFWVSSATISSHPVWSPDGGHLLFLGGRGGDVSTVDWWVAPLDGGAPKRLRAVTGLHLVLPYGLPWGFPRAWTSRFVYYVTGSTVEGVNLFRVPFDAARLEIVGEPERLTVGAGVKSDATLARDGRMVFAHTTWTLNVWSVAAQPDLGKVTGELAPVTSDETVKLGPRISRDGSTLVYTAFSGFEARGAEVRVRDLASGRETTVPATQGLVMDRMPVLSADGRVLAYRTQTDGRRGYFIRTAGSTVDRELCEDCIVHAFFSNPAFALIQYGAGELVRQEISTSRRTGLLHVDDAKMLDASLSEDDRGVAYLTGLPNGHTAILTAPLRDTPAPQPRILIREDDRILASPRWSPGGAWLYYMSASDGFLCVWGQRLDLTFRTPVGPPVAVLHVHGSRNMTFPIARPPLEVTPDRLMLTLGEVKSNIYLARLDRW